MPDPSRATAEASPEPRVRASGGGPRRWPWLLPVAAALAARLALLPLAAVIPHTGDSVGYVSMARAFLESGHFIETSTGVRPPLFAVLTAAGMDRSVDPPDAHPGSYLVQIACSVVMVALVMAVTRRVLGRAPALAAGWIVALEPTSVLYSSMMIMAEAPALLLMSLALLLLTSLDAAWDGAPGRRRTLVVLLGIVLGCGMLMKEVCVPFSVAVGLGLVLRRGVAFRRRIAVAGGTALVAALVLAPWTAYTYQRHGVPVLSSTATDLFLMHGNMPPTRSGSHWADGLAAFDERPTVKAQVRTARSVFRRALTEYPLLTAQRGWAKLRVFLGPEVITPAWIAYHLEGWRGWNDIVGAAYWEESWRLPESTWGRRVQVLAGVSAILVFSLGAAGLAMASGGRLRTVALALTAIMLVGYFLTWSESRYRLTLLPLYAPFAGLALTRLLRRGAGPSTRDAERVGLAVAILLLLTVFVLPVPVTP